MRDTDRFACRHSQVINSGETATMNCTVEGYPVESVEWLHDGVPVLTAQDTRIRLLAPLVLVIGSVGRRDKGMYQCLVRSDKENAQATAELKLGGQRAIRSFPFLSLFFLIRVTFSSCLLLSTLAPLVCGDLCRTFSIDFTILISRSNLIFSLPIVSFQFCFVQRFRNH